MSSAQPSTTTCCRHGRPLPPHPCATATAEVPHNYTSVEMPTIGPFKQLVASLRGRAPDAQTRSTQLDAFELLIAEGNRDAKSFKSFRDNSRK